MYLARATASSIRRAVARPSCLPVHGNATINRTFNNNSQLASVSASTQRWRGYTSSRDLSAHHRGRQESFWRTLYALRRFSTRPGYLGWPFAIALHGGTDDLDVGQSMEEHFLRRHTRLLGGKPRSVTSYATLYPSRAEHVASILKACKCYDTVIIFATTAAKPEDFADVMEAQGAAVLVCLDNMIPTRFGADNTKSDATCLSRLQPEIESIVGTVHVKPTYRISSRDKKGDNEIYRVGADILAAMSPKELYKTRWVAYATVRPTSADELRKVLDTCIEWDIAVVFNGISAMQSQTPDQWPLDYGTTIIVDLDLMDNTPFFASWAPREHDNARPDRLFHEFESFEDSLD